MAQPRSSYPSLFVALFLVPALSYVLAEQTAQQADRPAKAGGTEATEKVPTVELEPEDDEADPGNMPDVARAKLEFLSDVAEFRALDLSVTEEGLRQHIARHKLVSRLTDGGTTYTLYNRDGECVVVMFREGKCGGIQRLRADPNFGIGRAIGAKARDYVIRLEGTEDVKFEMLLVTLGRGDKHLQRESRVVTIPFRKEFNTQAYYVWFSTLPDGGSGKAGDRFESRLEVDGELQGGGFGGTIKPANTQTYGFGNLHEQSARKQDETSGVNWGEPLLGLRMRLTAPRGNEYRRGVRLPLLVEMQNVTNEPIRFADLHSHCDFKVHTETGGWLGIARSDVAISPWEGATGSLAPQQVIQWHVCFDRMWLNKPITAGSTVQVRVGVPRQIEEPDKLPRTNYSEPLLLKLIDAPPIALREGRNRPQLASKDVTDRWTEDMDLVYREAGGLFLRSLAIHIDGQGKVTMLNCGGVIGRTESRLDRDRLNTLAARLRQMKIWELSDVDWRLANPDEGEVRISLTYGGAAIVGDYANGLVRDNKTLAAFKTEMLAVIEEAVKTAAVNKDAEQRSTGPSGVVASYLKLADVDGQAKARAVEVVKDSQVISLHYEADEPTESVAKDAEFAYALTASTVTPISQHTGGKIYPAIHVVFSRFFGEAKDMTPDQWLAQMKRPLAAGYKLTKVTVVVAPSRDVMEKSFAVSQHVADAVVRELKTLGQRFGQLGDFEGTHVDRGNWAEARWPRYPHLTYKHDVGRYSKAGPEKLSEDWCVLYFRFAPISGNPRQRPNPGREYPNQGIRAEWSIESGDTRLNKLFTSIVTESLKELDALEIELGDKEGA